MALFGLINHKLDENIKFVYSENDMDNDFNSDIVKIPKNLIHVSKQDLLSIERMTVTGYYFSAFNLIGTSMDLSKIQSLSNKLIILDNIDTLNIFLI